VEGQKIVIIRVDGSSHAQFMRDWLSKAGYETWLADQGGKATNGTGYRTMILNVIPNLVILDWGLQTSEDLQIIQTIREDDRKERLPILVIGTEMSEEDVLASLEAGADICLTERLHPKVFVARVHSILRRNTANNVSKDLN
jgi:two-component system phosphate regulon response regulator PhoB